MRLIDALLIPEVMRGEVWVILRLPGVLGAVASDLLLPSQTLGVDPDRGTMRRGDRVPFDHIPSAGRKTKFGLGDEASVSLRQLLCECVLVEPGTLRPTCQRCLAPRITEDAIGIGIGIDPTAGPLDSWVDLDPSVERCDGRCEFDLEL